MKKNLELLSSYLKDRVKYILVNLVFIIIFPIVFALYALPLETVLYAALLCMFIAIILSIYDFYNYYKKHRTLTDAKQNITVTLSNLPIAKTLEEKDYHKLIYTIDLSQ